MTGTEFAVATEAAVVWVGAKFMTSEELAEEEKRLGLPGRALYFRGRSAVVGDLSGVVLKEVFGIFPAWLADWAAEAGAAVTSAEAVAAYTRVIETWGAGHLAGADGPGRTAELAFRVTDRTDASALPLFAGWRAAVRPESPEGALAFAVMLLRELRGGLHFAALRAYGVGVPDAVTVDPTGGRGRLLRTGWPEADADALLERAAGIPDLAERWQEAHRRTDESFGRAAAEALDAGELAELRERLTALA